MTAELAPRVPVTRGRPRRAPRPPAVQAHHAWDLLLVFALTAVALVGWSTTYQGAGWWIAGGIAALVGIGVAVAVVSARGGVEIVTLVLLLGYYLVSGPIVDGALGIDGLRTFEAGVRANVDGWPILLGTHPPIEATGAVLLAPVLLCLASAGIGAALALRSTRAALPLVPPTLMLGAVLLLAQPEPVSVLLQGVGYGALAMLWMRLRGMRIDEAAHGRDPARRWRLLGSVALVVLVALVAGLLAGSPRLGERLVLSRALPAYDVGEVATPLDTFRDFTRQPGRFEGNVYDRKLFTVTGAPAGARLRLAALDTYEGTRWRAGNETDPAREDDRFLRLSKTIDNPAEGREIGVAITPSTNYVLPWVPTIGAVQSFSFYDSARNDAQTHLRYNPATQTAVMDDRLEKGDTYAFTSVLTGGLLKPGMHAASNLLDRDLYRAGRFLDPAIQAWAVGSTGQIDAVLRVAAKLKRMGRYTDGASLWEARWRPGHSELRLGEDFVLAVPTAGDDEQYAAAMALIANRIGVPARVVVGAVLDRDGEVRGRDIEAWVEVRIDDGSWRTLPTDVFMGRRPPKREGVKEQLPARDFQLDQQPQQQPELEQPETQQPPEQQPDAEDTSDGGGIPWRWVLLVLLVVTLAAVPLAKAVRRRRRLTARRVTARYAGAWLELVDRARDLGTPVPTGLTRPAEARALLAMPDAPDGAVLTLAEEADARIFGADEPDPAEAAAFWALVRDQRSGLSADVPLRRRFWAFFSPASLRRPRPGPDL